MPVMDPAATAAVEAGMEGKDAKAGEAMVNARQIGSHHTYPYSMDAATRRGDCSDANPTEPPDNDDQHEEELDDHKARREHWSETTRDHPMGEQRGRHGTGPDSAAAHPLPPGPRTSAAWAASRCRPRRRRIRTAADWDTAAGEYGGREAGERGLASPTATAAEAAGGRVGGRAEVGRRGRWDRWGIGSAMNWGPP